MSNKNLSKLILSDYIKKITFFESADDALKNSDAISIGGMAWDLDGPSPVPWKDFLEPMNLSRYTVIKYKCGKKVLEIHEY